MKYYNLKTKKEQQGLEPVGDDWVEVNIVTNRPTDYPASFYVPTSNRPIRAIVGRTVTDTLSFTLLGLDSLKSRLYQSIKDERDTMLYGEVTVDDITLNIVDSRDIQVITSMGDTAITFKRGTRDRVSLTAEQATAFRIAYAEKVQKAFDWEEIEEDKIDSFTSYEEIAEYLEE